MAADEKLQRVPQETPLLGHPRAQRRTAASRAERPRPCCSSFRNIAPRICTMTCGWSGTASCSPGRCRRARRWILRSSGWRWRWKIIPIDYADFEGVIPAGEYGGGTVMVWDKGTYVPEAPDVGKSVEKGDLKFTLHGKKLKGSWVLVRTGSRYAADRGNRSWLLIKHRDSEASTGDITTEEPRSVKSRRLLAEIALDEGGDVLKAAEGDPPEALRALLDKNPKLVPRRRNRKAAVWSSKGSDLSSAEITRRLALYTKYPRGPDATRIGSAKCRE